MKTTKSTLLSAVAFALMFFSISSCKVSEEEGYSRWDADSNSMIDSNEFQTAWGEAGYYARWDANRDNFIEESEWNAGRNSYMRDFNEDQLGAFSEWDADGDGRLTEDEFRDGTFRVYDADQDGNLSDAEYTTWWGGFNGGTSSL